MSWVLCTLLGVNCAFATFETIINGSLDDGKCAIDLQIRSGVVGDVTTGQMISNAAREIIDTCVAQRPPQTESGGTVTLSSRFNICILEVGC